MCHGRLEGVKEISSVANDYLASGDIAMLSRSLYSLSLAPENIAFPPCGHNPYRAFSSDCSRSPRFFNTLLEVYYGIGHVLQARNTGF